jgi:hypothetical protein
MFKIVANPTFSTKVVAQVPGEDGEFREEDFRARFNVVPAGEMAGFDLASPAGTYDFLKRAIVSLDELVDGDGRPLAYSPEIGEQVLALPYARLALARAYLGGVTKARTGN